MEKKEFRKNAMDYLRQLSVEERERIERKQWEHVKGTKKWKEAGVVGLTVSKFPEWSTHTYIATAWNDGKKIAVPKVNAGDRGMTFYLIESYEQLKEGYGKIMEPDPEICSTVHKLDIDLLFVPGLLFNQEGYRIGFGGGFYDRFLETYDGSTISITSEAQLKPEIPLESHDIPVEMIVTENRLIRILKEDV